MSEIFWNDINTIKPCISGRRYLLCWNGKKTLLGKYRYRHVYDDEDASFFGINWRELKNITHWAALPSKK